MMWTLRCHKSNSTAAKQLLILKYLISKDAKSQLVNQYQMNVLDIAMQLPSSLEIIQYLQLIFCNCHCIWTAF